LSKGLTVTTVAEEAGDVQPATVCVTVYVPEVVTLIEGVLAVLDQRFPDAAEEVSVTLPPVQKVVGPPGVTVGAAGIAFTVIVLVP
jgi:hypothetical protein